jgi:uncharacterized protein YbjT (DUF2867 family)
MHIFLTGATGYVGSAILEASLRGGHNVTALVRDPEKAEHVSLRGARPIVGELGKPAAYVAAAEESDVIVHAALDRSKRSIDVDRSAIETLLGTAGRRLDRGQAASFICRAAARFVAPSSARASSTVAPAGSSAIC